MDRTTRKLQEALSKPFDYYRSVLAEKIRQLDERITALADDSDGKTYPEIHNEIRMAFTHIAGELSGLSVCNSDSANLKEGVPKARSEKISPEFEAFLKIVSSETYSTLKAAFDRCCSETIDTDALCTEAHDSMGHLVRAALDAEKAQFDVTAEVIEDTFSKYKNNGIQNVGKKGDFLSELEERRYNARADYNRGKLAETLGADTLAENYYRKAIEGIIDSYQYFKYYEGDLTGAGKIRSSARRKWRRRIIVEVILIIFGIVALLLG